MKPLKETISDFVVIAFSIGLGVIVWVVPTTITWIPIVYLHDPPGVIMVILYPLWVACSWGFMALGGWVSCSIFELYDQHFWGSKRPRNLRTERSTTTSTKPGPAKPFRAAPLLLLISTIGRAEHLPSRVGILTAIGTFAVALSGLFVVSSEAPTIWQLGLAGGGSAVLGIVAAYQARAAHS